MATIKYISNENLMNNQAEILEIDVSLGEWLAVKYFDRWQAGSPIPFSVYKNIPCIENDLFLRNGLKKPDEEIIKELMSLKDGNFVVCETPSEPTTVIAVLSIALSVAAVVLAPKPELPNNVSRSQESPNNQLGNRTNRARPLERVPDIKGQVLSIPDIIAPTYSTYIDNAEIEHGLYCVGRKQLSLDNIKDGDTPISLIEGASVGVYYPGNNPNIGTPDVNIGGHVSEPIIAAYRSNQVDGITLKPLIDDTPIDATTLFFDEEDGDGRIQSGNFDDSLYTIGTFIVLDNVKINRANTGPPDIVDLSGTYEIIDYQGNNLIFADPPPGLVDGANIGISGTVFSTNAQQAPFTDWIYNTATDFNSFIVNITAPNGIYRDNGSINYRFLTIDYKIEYETVDENNIPAGDVQYITGSITGNEQGLIAVTEELLFSTPRKFRLRAIRTTDKFQLEGGIVDEIKLEDVYAIKNIENTDFGDVTMIQTITKANEFSTAVKERQLNCVANELIYEYLGGGVFSETLTENNRGVQSYITDAIDPVIGNRLITEIDADGILALDNEIDNYFGNTDNGEFSYTFDSTDITFQDTTQIIFNAINCIAYREGSEIKAFFERQQDEPTMLFTHRSKRPDTEKYTREFNQQRLNDGVEFNWIDPTTNTTETIYLPEDRSALNPKKLNIPGIRNSIQANIRARREYNKILNQKQNCEVTVLAEGRYVNIGERINIVKGSRVLTQDGEVLAVDNTGLILTLSQPVSFDDPMDVYSIWLKNNDGTAQNITCTQGTDEFEVVLDFLPDQAPRTGLDQRRTEFSFGNDARHESQSWLAQEVDISDKLYVNLRAINYSDAYYADDTESFNAFSDGFSDGFS